MSTDGASQANLRMQEFSVLMIIVGAGASYDSIPSRLPGRTANEDERPPVADSLFAPRPIFEEVMRNVPQVMQIASLLDRRAEHESVEEVLAQFAGEMSRNPRRAIQLAAVRFYLQGIIARCEDGWYRERPVSMNMDALYDQIENARGDRAHSVFVTFNYDRLIEHALENSGQRFRSLGDYISPDRTRVIKLHGSVNWIRAIKALDMKEFGGTPWRVAQQVSDAIHELPEPGPIELYDVIPGSVVRHRIAIPAIAIPVRAKSRFECPDDHVEALREALPQVRAILTIGWRAGEEPFLEELSKGIRHKPEIICVTGGADGVSDANATVEAMRRHLPRANYQPYVAGFSEFIRNREIARLLNVAWVP